MGRWVTRSVYGLHGLNKESWAVMSLLMMTGNFLDYTQISPATN